MFNWTASGRVYRAVAAIASVAVGIGAAVAGAPMAASAAEFSPAPLSTTKPVPGKGAAPVAQTVTPLTTTPIPARPFTYGAAYVTDVPAVAAGAKPLPTAASEGAAQPVGAWAKLGSSGLSVAAATEDSQSARASGVSLGEVSATFLDPATAAGLGIDGLAIQVARTGGSGGDEPIAIRIPDTILDSLYGADYASRVRWVQVDASSSTAPGDDPDPSQTATPAPEVTPTSAPTATPAPSAAAPSATPAPRRITDGATSAGGSTEDVGTARDTSADATIVTATLAPGSSGVVLAAASTPVSSTGTGSFGATPLSAQSSWDVSAQTGAFSWSYPISVPPAAAGPQPDVSLSYDSQTVDGQTSATNNQSSVVGEGWDLSAGGFISRQYQACSEDGHTSSGDECWSTYNASMSFGSHSGPLVQISASTTSGTMLYKLQNDDGTRVQYITGSAAGSPCYNAASTYLKDCWLVTTTDGTKYYFGLGKIPNTGGGTATATNSVWTVPVYSDDSGEPGYSSTFSSAKHTEAWQWNLDYVIDIHGNAEAFYYNAETNKYRENNSTAVTYTRGGTLKEIDYGFRAGDGNVSGAPSDKVVFGYDTKGRCTYYATTPANCTTENVSGLATAPAHATYYPDTPYDQLCTGSSCTGLISPSFWTTAMLDSITTSYDAGSTYQTVSSWALAHSFPSPGDGPTAMWLSSVTHTGSVGGTIAEPSTLFSGSPYQNRVNVGTDGLSVLDAYRLTQIETSLGGVIGVSYAPPECTGSDKATIVANPQSNTKLCYPQNWAPQITPPVAAQTDIFNKYVVQTLTESPVTGGAYDANQITNYTYSTPRWRYVTSAFVPSKYRTWSDFAGFASAEIIEGDPATPLVDSDTVYQFFQGMDQDRAAPSGGTRSVNITIGSTTVADSRWWAGRTWDERVYDSADVASRELLTETYTVPWASAAFPDNDADFASRAVGDSITRKVEGVSGGGTRTTTTTTTYVLDSTANVFLPTTVEETHSDANTDCTIQSYATDNTTAWLIGLPKETDVLATSCADTGVAVYPDDAVSSTRNYFDNAASLSAMPSVGDVTKSEKVDFYTGSTPDWFTSAMATYDALGRTLTTTDALGRTSSTAYTPSATAATGSGPLTQEVVTNPVGWTTTTAYVPAWGAVTSVTDANGYSMTADYDALGRRVAVWTPAWPKATYGSDPWTKFTYTMSQTSPNVVLTQQNSGDDVVPTYEFVDGLARSVQTQTVSATGGAVVTDNAYDALGRIVRSDNAYWTGSVNPSATMFVPTTLANLPSYTTTSYDGVGRAISSMLTSYGAVVSTEFTSYEGADRTTSTPPAGGTPTTKVTNSLGQTTEATQYLAAAPSPAAPQETTSYAYDKRGNLTSMVDPAGNQWTWTYDVLNRQQSATDPDTGTTTSTYDLGGRLLSTTDARGTTLSHSYDVLDRETAEYQGPVSTGAELASWTYDLTPSPSVAHMLGKGTSATSYVGSLPGIPGLAYTETVTGYDDGGNTTGTTVSIPSGAPAFAGTSYSVTTGYNPAGNPTTVHYTAEGGLAAETVSTSYVDGRPAGLSTTGVSAQVGYTSLNQLSQIARGPSGNRFYSEYGYSAATGEISATEALQVVGSTPTDLSQTAYTRDLAGNVIEKNTTSDIAATDTQCFTLDYQENLTEAWTPASNSCGTSPASTAMGGPAPYWQTYTVDSATGSRTSTVRHGLGGTADVTDTYAYPTSGSQPHAVQTVTHDDGTTTPPSPDSYTYDASGNTLTRLGQTLSYDATGKLTSDITASGTDSRVYDASGNLLLDADPVKGYTLYLPGTDLTYSPGAAATTAVRTYTLAGAAIAERSSTIGGSGTSLYWLSGDDQGTAQAEVNASTGAAAVRYEDPFGNPRGSSVTWSSDHGFLNAPTSASTGLTHLGARDYDPLLGRFTTVDPVLDPKDPMQNDGYAYAHNTPVNAADPSGAYIYTRGMLIDGQWASPAAISYSKTAKSTPSKGGGGASAASSSGSQSTGSTPPAPGGGSSVTTAESSPAPASATDVIQECMQGQIQDCLADASELLDEFSQHPNETEKFVWWVFGFNRGGDGRLYTRAHPLQLLGGYNKLYDEVFHAATSMGAKMVSFAYGGHSYVIWAWKGYYLNMGDGGEGGTYEQLGKTPDDDGHWFANPFDSNLPQMKITVRGKNNGPLIGLFEPGAAQVWNGVWNPEVTDRNSDDFTVTDTVTFPNAGMYRQFVLSANKNPDFPPLSLDPEHNAATFGFRRRRATR